MKRSCLEVRVGALGVCGAVLLVAAVHAVPGCAAGNANETATGAGGADFTTASSTGSGVDGACASSVDEATNVAVNIYIMFDKSGSMAGPKWSQATAALQGFFMDPASDGARVALRFFPDAGCDESCNVQGCAVPKVPLGELTELSAPTDSHEQALIDAFIGVVPSGGTPLSIALDGALAWAADVATKHPGEQSVVALVTDGEPTECNSDGNYLVLAAKSAFEKRGILTFAIGLEGSKASLIDAIAAAGGTKDGIVVGTGNAQEELQTALNTIRDHTVACEFAIPKSGNGEPVDTSHVNVVFDAGDGTGAVTVGQVHAASACEAKAAWHYDSGSAPTKIILCPAACAEIKKAISPKVEIVVGCVTIAA
ncbi:MAG: VWA domain-containing protein [Myxococcales bacterium]|nr:VWA domain-containing protein [Myxococcales bacterium]